MPGQRGRPKLYKTLTDKRDQQALRSMFKAKFPTADFHEALKKYNDSDLLRSLQGDFRKTTFPNTSNPYLNQNLVQVSPGHYVTPKRIVQTSQGGIKLVPRLPNYKRISSNVLFEITFD